MTLNQNAIKNDFFSNSPISKRSLVNQVDCILSLDANNSNDHTKVSELFTTYNKILNDKTTPEFQNSLNESKDCIKSSLWSGSKIYEEKVNSLKKNKPQSFLVVPISSTNHLFCALVRKNHEGFSATLVNASKGGRRGDDRGDRVGYEEYIFHQDNLPNLIKAFTKTNMHQSGFSALTNEEIYKLFEQLSDKRFPLNVVSRDQKDGNCYIKEPEKAIKFALATSNFSHGNLLALRNPNQVAFKPKWPLQTEEVHRRYINELIQENPTMSTVLTNRFEKHLSYKHYALENSQTKLPINGRGLQKSTSIEFQDNQAETKGTAIRSRDKTWTYKDSNDQVIGYGKSEGNMTEYYDRTNRALGYSTKDNIGEKYYDTSNKLIGFARTFNGMIQHTGESSIEIKGVHPIDNMLKLSKSFDASRFMKKQARQKDVLSMDRS